MDTLENQLYEVDNVEREFDRELYMFTKELNGKYRETAQSQFQEIQESKAMESEAYLDSESEPMESEVTILNRARNEFMSGLTNDTSEIKILPRILFQQSSLSSRLLKRLSAVTRLLTL